MVDVNTSIEVQPALFPGGAIRVIIEALLDPEDGTTTFRVEARDIGAGKLVALWAMPPRRWSAPSNGYAEVFDEFCRVIEEHSGPF